MVARGRGVEERYTGSLGLADAPCGPVGKNPLGSARDAGSIPGPGTKIPQAAGS